MLDMLESWSNRAGVVNTTGDLLDWVQQLNETTKVSVRRTSVQEDSFWFYDDYKGEILNRKRSFFSIMGVRYFDNERFVSEQPIILQKEIGYLGIIVKKIDGVLHFLMQAKVEPGNVNCVQISPTIQATKSNFTRAHGGRLPYYFEYFEKAGENGTVLYDQIQSEQGSRFYGKRNRNIILLIEKEIPVYPNYKWMTLGQIKELMKIDNLVNMDTRTVLSGIPFVTCLHDAKVRERAGQFFTDSALMKSVFEADVADSGTWVSDQWKHLQCHRYSVSAAGGHAFAGFAENIGMRSPAEAGKCVLLCFPGSLAHHVFFFRRRIPAVSRNDVR